MKTLEQVYRHELVRERKKSLSTRFFEWCHAQEEQRLLWLGIILFTHGCVITPLTILFVVLAGNSLVLWPFIIGAIAMSLIVNLAALPTRITIPVFFLSLLIDFVVIINCIGHGLDLSAIS